MRRGEPATNRSWEEISNANALQSVRRNAKQSRAARARFEISIIAASQAGASTRTIAEAAGLSHQRIWQILNDPDSSHRRVLETLRDE